MDSRAIMFTVSALMVDMSFDGESHCSLCIVPGAPFISE